MKRIKEVLSAPHIIIFTCLTMLTLTAAIPSLSLKEIRKPITGSENLLAGGILMSDGIRKGDGIVLSDRFIVLKNLPRNANDKVGILSSVNGQN